MKRYHFLTIFSVLLLSSSAKAARSLVLFGGGGEPKNSTTTIFDDTLTSMDKYLSDNSWKAQISFDGGHSKTDAFIQNNFENAQNTSSFTPGNYNAIIKYYEGQLKSGAMKTGDQLMIMIDSHGALKGDNETTHRIALGEAKENANLNNLEGMAYSLSLDSLKSLTELAKEKGVKLAVIDFSSHSGNSLALANSNTCVIASAGEKNFAYNNFSEVFIQKMKSGKSLEEVFLETRSNASESSYPMISTPAGKAISDSIYPYLAPYLYSYEQDSRIDKLNNYLVQTSSNAGICARENQYLSLLKSFAEIQAIGDQNLDKNMPELETLKKQIAEYKNIQDRYLKLLNTWGVPELSRVEQLQGIGKSGKKTERLSKSYTWQEILDSDYVVILKNLETAKNGTTDPSMIAFFQASINMYSAGQAKQLDILTSYPGLKNYKKNINEQMKQFQDVNSAAYQIGLEERKVYDKTYHYLSHEKTSASNPCKDFLL